MKTFDQVITRMYAYLFQKADSGESMRLQISYKGSLREIVRAK